MSRQSLWLCIDNVWCDFVVGSRKNFFQCSVTNWEKLGLQSYGDQVIWLDPLGSANGKIFIPLHAAGWHFKLLHLHPLHTAIWHFRLRKHSLLHSPWRVCWSSSFELLCKSVLGVFFFGPWLCACCFLYCNCLAKREIVHLLSNCDHIGSLGNLEIQVSRTFCSMLLVVDVEFSAHVFPCSGDLTHDLSKF